MENFIQMAGIQSVLFVYMVVGYACRKANIIKSSARQSFTDFVIYITLPCMVFNSFDMELTAETFKVGAQALIIASVLAVCALIVGRFAYNGFAPRTKSILQYGTLVSNAGFAGLPIVESAYGSEGLFIGSLFIIPTRILMWSAGISLFTQAPLKQRIKNVLLNPGIIAVELGLLRLFFHIPLPAFLNKAIGAFGASTTPLAMVIVGLILAEVEIKTVFDKRAFILVAVRQLAFPLIALLVLRMIPGIDPTTLKVAVVITGMPIGSTTAILADKYGADADFASKCVFVSTLTSLITVPILTLFL
ncbi:MAG: AEC family transporter [Clostridia bacterium]|jgi:malate permease and related proteins|nr:AEC family transporter [Clostridia bacterium]NLS85329.1 AEC family transporter [Oscillospiraceae bacterium]